MDSVSSIQEFDNAVERCTEDMMEFFAKLNGIGNEKTYDEVSAMLDRFDDFRTAIENSVRRKTAAWLRPWNSLAPVHKLPIELVQIIFHYILFAISSIWRDVADRTPSLWTQLSSQDHINFVSEALSKSQNYNLQLKYVGALGNTESPFLDEAFLHLDRWEAVAIQDPHGDLMYRYLASPAPRLKKLAVSTQSGFVLFGHNIPAPLFGGEWASLEEFRAVRWKHMDWTDVHCHRLKVLEIEDFFYLDMEKLFSIITENLDLRVLRIHSITFREDFLPPQDHEPITLRFLTDFTFTSTIQKVLDGRIQVRDTPIMRMLQRVQIPACTLFSVEFGLSGNALPDEFFSLIPSPIEIFRRRGGRQSSDPEPPTARLAFRDGDFRCEVLGNHKSTPQYQVLLKSVPPDINAKWARRELVDAWTGGPKPAIELQCYVDEGFVELDDIFDMQDLGSVVEMNVIGTPNASGLAQRLATPVTSDSGTLIGPFLGLRTLKLSNCGLNGTDVLWMMQERFTRITNPTNLAGQSTTEGNPNIPAEEGITIKLGEGMDRFSRSIAREIRETPGVKELVLYSDSSSTHDGSSSSSEESIWSPRVSEVSDETDSISDDGAVHYIEELPYEVE
ncbi:hypothetical protein M407DRAFT_21307 [Tulasnella calospora MUT 4182]|uniref:F-box domain-containing protein n=1 Tax=Tulasnella calospora MUT 4182 TaxID=1051891 RepID=A0A0C3L6T3_9AGAM|nr:hypothetical protein M407DRAFT_21307 [Tulasnella calospora MUT 4182]